MRQSYYELGEPECLTLLGDATSYILAANGVASSDETETNELPLIRSYLGAIEGRTLFVHGGLVGERSGLADRPVSIQVEQPLAGIPSYFTDKERACPASMLYQSVQARGVVRRRTDRAEKARVLALITAKYQPEGGYVSIDHTHPLYARALDSIDVWAIELRGIVGRRKLLQKKTASQAEQVLEGLWRRGEGRDLEVIELVRRVQLVEPTFLHAPSGARLHVWLPPERTDEAVAILMANDWNEHRSEAIVRRSIEAASAWIGATDAESGALLGLARAVSDRTRYAMVFDVWVAERWRGRGLGRRIMELLLDHPALRDVERVELNTREAHPFYRKLGFHEIERSVYEHVGYRAIEQTLEPTFVRWRMARLKLDADGSHPR
ncbi:MAG: GNAT family N-acetyltransferase [Myxococcales bacterium]|nr:GNAT family N-acetyltransferase [Myxococcales bacterium]